MSKDLFITEQEKDEAVNLIKEYYKQNPDPPKRFSGFETAVGMVISFLGGAVIGAEIYIMFTRR